MGPAALPTSTALIATPFIYHGSADYAPIVTPPPTETVQTGMIGEISAPRNACDCTWREGIVSLLRGTKWHLFVQRHGQEIELGNDYGDAQFWSASAQYLAWTLEAAGSPMSGLYIHVFATGQDISVAPWESVGNAVVDGDWVIYTNWGQETGQPPFPRMTRRRARSGSWHITW